MFYFFNFSDNAYSSNRTRADSSSRILSLWKQTGHTPSRDGTSGQSTDTRTQRKFIDLSSGLIGQFENC